MAQLSKDDWLHHGLKTLAEQGAAAMKADRLSRSLGVSRGSFYWHFKDIDAFCEEVLSLWAARSTHAVIAGLSRAEGVERLNRLLSLAMNANAGLEQAVRAWATHSPAAAKAVRGVDVVRLQYLRESLAQAGVAPDQAEARATFIYLAYIGRTVAEGPAAVVDENAVRYIAELMTA